MGDIPPDRGFGTSLSRPCTGQAASQRRSSDRRIGFAGAETTLPMLHMVPAPAQRKATVSIRVEGRVSARAHACPRCLTGVVVLRAPRRLKV
ncbi:hypothetical protein chiPu_0025030 [Chiloscyllium punctatum]|uniref:Uncharacterized protein n=1 Tax=Chiloscyllium punctatum TaxID=137246 RepID=A0A401TFP5_CHIPU|nr:hypothetical protein [Chiloscyllium punctatum]